MSKTPRTTKSEAIRILAAYGHAACDRIEQLETELADKDKLIEQMRETLKALNLHLALLRPVLKVEDMPK